MNILNTLNTDSNNSILSILNGDVSVDLDTENRLERIDALGVNADIEDIEEAIAEIEVSGSMSTDNWTIEETDNGNLVFYYNGQERYRIRQ